MGFEFDAVKYRGSGSNEWTMGIWLDGDWKGHARKVGREGEWWPPYKLGDYYGFVEPCRKAGEFRKTLAGLHELAVLLADLLPENPKSNRHLMHSFYHLSDQIAWVARSGGTLGRRKTLANQLERLALRVESPRLRKRIEALGAFPSHTQRRLNDGCA